MPLWQRCYTPGCVHAQARPYENQTGICLNSKGTMTTRTWGSSPLDPIERAGIRQETFGERQVRFAPWLNGVQPMRQPSSWYNQNRRPARRWWYLERARTWTNWKVLLRSYSKDGMIEDRSNICGDVDIASVMCGVFYSESGGDWSSDSIRIRAIKHNKFQRKNKCSQ